VEAVVSMTRSDLPHVERLAPDTQRAAVDAMWRAWSRAEREVVLSDDAACPVAYVATMAELLEAALAAVDRPHRARTDIGTDAGAYQCAEYRDGDDSGALQWMPCGEPDGHAAHRWSRERWAAFRFCSGRPLTDAEFLAMHPLPVPSAFVEAGMDKLDRGAPGV
jgi:hypothetical protein